MKENYLGAYGRLLQYVAAIKSEAAVKAALSLGVNASYVFQIVVMERGLSRVFNGAGIEGILPLAAKERQAWTEKIQKNVPREGPLDVYGVEAAFHNHHEKPFMIPLRAVQYYAVKISTGVSIAEA
jgi:hypothetical protein